jgi:heparosan-N-sulfate-glucuronate 5-epimerase
VAFLLKRRWGGVRGFLFGTHDYWHPKLSPTLGRRKGDASYYLDFTVKADHPGPFDSHGVPFTVYGGKIGRQHYPIDIAQYALGHHARWLASGSDAHRLIFLRQADWLAENLMPTRAADVAGLWMANFDWHELQAPWPSAMAQGQGLSVLVRAHAMTGLPIYLERAHAAYAGLLLPVDEGGVTRYDDGMPFFEEAPTVRPSRILNGFIFALWGAMDYRDVGGAPAAQRICAQAEENLLRYLPRFDIGFWTRYDLQDGLIPRVCSAFYQELHVHQMTAMYQAVPNEAYYNYARRWQRQLSSVPNRATALVLKLAQR